VNCFYTDPMPAGNFVAFYADGSGASIFNRRDSGVFDAGGNAMPDGVDWYQDAGYCFWLPLPDDFSFFFEKKYLSGVRG